MGKLEFHSSAPRPTTVMERLKAVVTSTHPVPKYSLLLSHSHLPVYPHHLHFYFLPATITRLQGIHLFKDLSKSSAVYFWISLRIRAPQQRSGPCRIYLKWVTFALWDRGSVGQLFPPVLLGWDLTLTCRSRTRCSQRLPALLHHVPQASACFCYRQRWGRRRKLHQMDEQLLGPRSRRRTLQREEAQLQASRQDAGRPQSFTAHRGKNQQHHIERWHVLVLAHQDRI